MKIFINLFIGISVGLLLLWRIAVYLVEKSKEEEMTVSCVRWAGRYFRRGTEEGYFAFPRDDGSTEEEQLAALREQWQGLQSDKEDQERGRHSPDFIKAESKYYDARIWTVIKNLPENPPDNLVVLATRNIAPSSLRTRLTESDMQKHIQFDEQFEFPKNMSILKKYAVLIYANGDEFIAPIVRPTSKRAYKTTYDAIYKQAMVFYGKEAYFDLTTNPANGLQVKYLTPAGEVIPAND